MSAEVSEYDGQIQVGPIKGVPGTVVLSAMRRYDLNIARGATAEYSAKTHPEGFTIRASGPGVSAYLVNSEGISACSSDIEDMARLFLRPGSSFGISGRHGSGEDAFVVYEAQVKNVEGRIEAIFTTRLFSQARGPMIIDADEGMSF